MDGLLHMNPRLAVRNLSNSPSRHAELIGHLLRRLPICKKSPNRSNLLRIQFGVPVTLPVKTMLLRVGIHLVLAATRLPLSTGEALVPIALNHVASVVRISPAVKMARVAAGRVVACVTGDTGRINRVAGQRNCDPVGIEPSSPDLEASISGTSLSCPRPTRVRSLGHVHLGPETVSIFNRECGDWDILFLHRVFLALGAMPRAVATSAGALLSPYYTGERGLAGG